jgi:hypothetical protein
VTHELLERAAVTLLRLANQHRVVDAAVLSLAI